MKKGRRYGIFLKNKKERKREVDLNTSWQQQASSPQCLHRELVSTSSSKEQGCANTGDKERNRCKSIEIIISALLPSKIPS